MEFRRFVSEKYGFSMCAEFKAKPGWAEFVAPSRTEMPADGTQLFSEFPHRKYTVLTLATYLMQGAPPTVGKCAQTLKCFFLCK